MRKKRMLLVAATTIGVCFVGWGVVRPTPAQATVCFRCLDGWDEFEEEYRHVDFWHLGHNDKKGDMHNQETSGKCNEHWDYVGGDGGGGSQCGEHPCKE